MKNTIQVITRMTHLLDAIALNDEAASLKVLSAETGLHPSTAFRILASLVEEGFVARDNTGYYQLGAKLLQLSSHVHARIDLRREAKAVLEWLRDELGETANLVVREGDEVVYLDRATTNRMMRVEHVVGGRAPLHVTAVGKLMLADGGTQACRHYAERTGLPAYTPNTITDINELIETMHTYAARGYALDKEEAEQGVGCIGVLVRDNNGNIAAGLSASFPIERFSDEWVQHVIQAGEHLSARLGSPSKPSRTQNLKYDGRDKHYSNA